MAGSRVNILAEVPDSGLIVGPWRLRPAPDGPDVVTFDVTGRTSPPVA
jgi:hypothetical protein